MELRLLRTRFDLFAAFVLIVYAAIFTSLVWVVTAALDLGDTGLTVALAVLVVLWLFWSGTYVFSWTRMRRIDVPLTLQGSGILGHSQFGTLEVPWAAVRSAAVERAWTGRRLRIRLVPPGDPHHADIVNHVTPQMMQVVDKRGMRYTLRILDVDVDRLREAFVVQSGGRVRVS